MTDPNSTGCGQSTPASSLVDNTTAHLIADIESIRKELQIETMNVFGGSWGSTLSLAYAQAHPSRVRSLTLRGIFTLRREELDFFYQGPGTGFLFPDCTFLYPHYLVVRPNVQYKRPLMSICI